LFEGKKVKMMASVPVKLFHFVPLLQQFKIMACFEFIILDRVVVS